MPGERGGGGGGSKHCEFYKVDGRNRADQAKVLFVFIIYFYRPHKCKYSCVRKVEGKHS